MPKGVVVEHGIIAIMTLVIELKVKIVIEPVGWNRGALEGIELLIHLEGRSKVLSVPYHGDWDIANEHSSFQSVIQIHVVQDILNLHRVAPHPGNHYSGEPFTLQHSSVVFNISLTGCIGLIIDNYRKPPLGPGGSQGEGECGNDKNQFVFEHYKSIG
ncbi:hypothetical protein SDC9_101905 [bioreactor metagenome]|uniref:Uncharacterized protein n=1 Tax=bioreactor metagenome TaxID=1076179 RepID=A0A645APU8_9ZZZZ